MSTPAVTLPAATALGRSFEHGLDVNLGTFGAPQYQPVRRMSAWAPTYTATTTDVTTYDDRGATNEDVSGRSFAATFTVQANRSTITGLYLPEVEALLAAAKAKGEGALIDVRWYHKPEIGTPNPNDAGRAQVRVDATRQNTGNAEVEVYSITLTGKGAFEPIANPFTGWDATAPIVAAATPAEAITGDLITITGSGLLGATSVTIDGAPVEFLPINAATIAASLPEGEAGPVPIVVTTAGGVSAAFTYTRGA